MQITFYGAAREVTGSMHLVDTGEDRILLDCGLFQGRRRDCDQKNRLLPFDPALLTNLVLSHAHIDHSGRIPLLTAGGFSGRVICSRATAHACAYLLPDSAHIQESDAHYLNYKRVRNALVAARSVPGGAMPTHRRRKAIARMLKKGPHALDADAIRKHLDALHLQAVEPLYTMVDAEAALGFFDGHPYRQPIQVGRHTTATLYDAGHILGSALVVLRRQVDGRRRTICFSGDLGRFDKPIVHDPTLHFAPEDRHIDLLVLESTYGGRRHAPTGDLEDRLRAVLTAAAARGGVVVIPSFAFGRTQELLYVIHKLYAAGAVPRLPVYVDSPLATRLTRVFGEHPEIYDRETHRDFLERGANPFWFDQVSFVGSVEESIALTRAPHAHVVIAASGMCESGRVLHHLRYRIHDPRNTILVVGYMAAHTLGRRILDLGEAHAADGHSGPAPMVRLLGKHYPLRARVERLDGFSAHADHDELLRFLQQADLTVRRIALVHGETDQMQALAADLRGMGYEIGMPLRGETMAVG